MKGKRSNNLFPNTRMLGRVAEFCPVCRDIQAHWLLRPDPGLQIQIGEPGPSCLVVCQTCGTPMPSDSKTYSRAERDETLTLEALLQRTSPELARTMAPRLALEAQVAAGLVPPEIRSAMIREALEVGATLWAMENWTARGPGARARSVVYGLAASLGISAGMIAAVILWGPHVRTMLGWRTATIAGEAWLVMIGLVWVIVMITPWMRRKRGEIDVRRRVRAMLRPLEPTAAEVKAVIADLESLGEDCRWLTAKGVGALRDRERAIAA
jgi:hypothetical protein